MIYKTDLQCAKKQFAYFIKFDGQLFCIATTDIKSAWQLGEFAKIDVLDLEPISLDKFFKPSIYGKCKESLSVEFIESLITNQKSKN